MHAQRAYPEASGEPLPTRSDRELGTALAHQIQFDVQGRLKCRAPSKSSITDPELSFPGCVPEVRRVPC